MAGSIAAAAAKRKRRRIEKRPLRKIGSIGGMAAWRISQRHGA